MNRTELLKKLKWKGFNSLELDRGLESFEKKYLEAHGSNSGFKTFEWNDVDGEDIKIDIKINSVEVSEDEFEYSYEIQE